jgi:ankyrin repeat protein
MFFAALLCVLFWAAASADVTRSGEASDQPTLESITVEKSPGMDAAATKPVKGFISFEIAIEQNPPVLGGSSNIRQALDDLQKAGETKPEMDVIEARRVVGAQKATVQTTGGGSEGLLVRFSDNRNAGILLVDDDGGLPGGTYTDIEYAYINALDDNGYVYDYYVVDWTDPLSDGPDLTTMQAYSLVIWFTGETWGYYGLDVLTLNDEANLGSYLTGGGYLFLSSQDYLYANYPSAGTFSPGQFPYDYLGLASVSQDAVLDPYTVVGGAGSVAEGMQFNALRCYDDPGVALWTDYLLGQAGAVDVFLETGTATAVQYESGDFMTVFTTTEFCGLVDGSPSTRAALMAAIVSVIPHIVSTVPAQNGLNVSVSTDITVTFDIDMDSTTINDSTFIVNAMTTGLHAGTLTYDGPTKTATFDPAEVFAPGELVTVVLTDGIEPPAGLPLVDYAWSFTTAADDGSGTFPVQVAYSAGDDPRSVFASDLDGDGDLDLAAANELSDNVSVRLNNGDGTFAARIDYAAGDGPFSVFAADLDGDGDLDLAVANELSDSVSALLNNGDGTFASQVNYAAGDGPRSVFVSDLDGDGDLDLAAANGNSDNVSVLLNNGDGTFADSVNYAAGDGPRSMFASDLDGDGDLDLAAANEFSDSVSVLLNNGDGTFAPCVNYAAGDGTYCVFASDLDGDGDLDLAAANLNSDNVSVLLNNGDGTFASQATYAVGDSPRSVFASDLDGDGDLDLAVANYYSDNVSVLLNNGDGTFTDLVNYAAWDGPHSIFAADLDGDGDLDLATANVGTNNVLVLLNENAGCDYVTGDVNGSDNYNGLDVTYGVNFFKFGTPAPQCADCPLCPGWHYCGDVNASCNYNGLDITYGVNYFKFGSPGPVPCGDCPPSGS